MAIWGDAEACPNVINEGLYRVAERTKTLVTFVANQSLRVPAGFDVADNEIVKRVEPGDLVITADIPLVAEVLEKGGERYLPATIREKLTLMDTMRASGV
ncbi:hypothetical protein EIO60_01570|nr:hypothetical protein [Candidatus Pantoea persica]